MQIVIDLDLREAVSDLTVKSPAPPYSGKSQDTQGMEIYFVESGIVQDLGTGPAIKYGLIGPSGPSLLVLCTTYTRQIDINGNVYYLGYPIFNTSNLATALGTNVSISCISEVRYQLTTGEIEHTLDIPITIYRTILSEITSDLTTAAFTAPAIGSNVTVAIGGTTWLQVGQQLTIATAGIYQVISITDGTHFVAQNTGQPGNASSGTTIASGSTVAGAPVNALTTYPPSNTLELISTRDVASGHAGLDAGTHLNPAVIPVDNVTIQILDGQVASSFILAETAASFVTPAANATVNVTLVSSSGLVVGQYVRIPIAGYYVVASIPDGTHANLTNNGDPFNAVSGVTITTDAPLLPAQAAAGGGSTGVNAYTTLTSGFTMPAVGATVSIVVGATGWMGGSGYNVFISGAGYFAISSITDATHAVVTNLGGSANAAPATSILSGGVIAAGGPQGPQGLSGAGLAAYDALATGFTMPAVSGAVTITIGNTAWMGLNQIIYIATAGYFQVANVINATQASLTNLGYPGNATVTTAIASGSRVSPGGLQGVAGTGGSGRDAFTTLSANFTQPAINAAVSINVAATAWMLVGAAIYIVGGGYYTISSITDTSHAVVTNLGYTGNAASGATVTGSGTQGVGPAGIQGSGNNAYTTLSANFSMPAVASSVTVTVGNSGFVGQSQNIYIVGAGYFSVSSIPDATHLVLINLGSLGNVSSGSTITAGAAVTTAGATGPTGAQGPTGAAGSGGGTSMPSGPFDPRNGYYLYDDFLWFGASGGSTLPNEWGFFAGSGGGTINTQDSNGWAGTSTNRGQGCLIMTSGAANSNAYNGGTLARGTLGSVYNALILGLGPFEMAGRIAIQNASLPPTGQGFRLSFGLWQQSGGAANLYQASNPYQCLMLDYSPDSNSGNLRLEYANGNNAVVAPTFVNCTGTITAAAFHWWSFKVDTSGTVTVYMDGVLIGTFTGVAPLGVPLIPVLGLERNTAVTTNWQIYFDAIYAYQSYTR